MPIDVPEHISSRRRDGRREVMLHRSMAVIGDEKIEIKAARSTVWLPRYMPGPLSRLSS